jgi:predicted metalloendopeptidase
LFLLLAACGSKEPPPPVPVDLPAPGTYGAELLASLDATIDPCSDFYQYACGGWLKATPLPADKPTYTRSFSVIRDRNEEMLRGLLDAAATNPDDKLGAFWAACQDQGAIDAAGDDPLDPWLAKVDTLVHKKGLGTLVGELRAAGFPMFFDQWVDADAKDPRTAILQVYQGGLGLPEASYYLAPEHAEARDKYRQHVAKLLQLGGVATTAEDTAKRADAIVAFETELAKVSWEPVKLRDATLTYNRLDFEGLSKATPTSFSWKDYLTAQGRPEITAINVGTPPFFEGLEPLVKATSLPVLKDYMKWKIVASSASELAKPFEDESFAFNGKYLTGQSEQEPRWKRCIDKTDAALGDLLAQAYVAKAFAGDSKPIAVDMIQRVEASFEAGLPSLEWMDDATRTVAVEKARAIVNKIGYPDKWRTYPFEVTRTDHFANMLEAGAEDARYWLDKADKPVDKDTWYMTAPTVNAYYNPSQNEIVFPAGILQPPFFSVDDPMAANFGAMGMVMGHEITHGFDDEGRKFDSVGRLVDWWSPEVIARFEERAECVQEQYSKYEVQPGLFLNGELTLGENIADIGGTRTAFRAYQKWIADRGVEAPIGGLDGDRQFFVAMAQAWCTVASPQIEQVRVRTDPHSLPRYRVNGPLVDLPEFAEAFECAEGTPMNPVAQCEVW